MEERVAESPHLFEASWKAFEGYLEGSLLGARIQRVLDEDGRGAPPAGFIVELGDEVHQVRVVHEFWRDIQACHIRTALSLIRLADEIRSHGEVAVVMANGTPAVHSH